MSGDTDRIGVVGRNGDGKTTLLNLIAGREEPDTGRIARTRGLQVGYLDQRDELDDSHTVREVVLGGKADHEWAAEVTTREVVEELLAGVSLDRVVHGLSGGERRRCSLARLLLEPHDLMILDEPTNHLDVEAVSWLAQHLSARRTALVVVTHDRWFLDAVCETTWEVHPAANGAGVVDVYDGGYAAFVLAKAERQRQAASSEQRRQNLVRKELAWLRRGPPARTSKPKFRIDAANALIDDVPEPRDRLELQKFATQRLGKDVLDMEHVDLVRGERTLLSDATWRLGPGRPGRDRRRQRRGQDLGAVAARAHAVAAERPGEARPDGRAAAPHPGDRRGRPGGAGAGHGRGRSRRVTRLSDGLRRHRRPRCWSGSASPATG